MEFGSYSSKIGDKNLRPAARLGAESRAAKEGLRAVNGRRRLSACIWTIRFCRPGSHKPQAFWNVANATSMPAMQSVHISL
jgi:hypothetical protein